jgi:hypothetical protein
VCRRAINSDEPQHLHVVWGWTQGLVQYKDFFDNHMPLFHLLFVPVLSFFGERADILYLMRFVMFPFYILSLYFVYLIGSILYSKRIGAWAAVILCFSPRFFVKSLEFRSDCMWMAIWLLLLVVLLRGKINFKKAFFIGILLGLTFAISLKTVLLAGVLFLSLLTAAIMVWAGGYRISWNKILLMSFYTLFGISIVFFGLILFFAYKNAISPMFYGAIKHNILSSGTGNPSLRHLFILMFPVTIMLAFFEKKGSFEKELLIKRIVMLLLGPWCLFGLLSFWPVFSKQDLLPIIPLLVVIFVYLINDKIIPFLRAEKLRLFIFSTAAIIEIIYIFVFFPINKNESERMYAKLGQILKLTKHGEYVMDLKGESIFRPRPFFYALEHMTKNLIEKGLIRDTIPEDIIEKRCYVSINDTDEIPERGRDFLNNNFIYVGIIRAAGYILEKTDRAKEELEFNILIPGRYAVVVCEGQAKGSLDNAIYNGPVELDAGYHRFIPDFPKKKHIVVWANVIERGFSPFDCLDK